MNLLLLLRLLRQDCGSHCPTKDRGQRLSLHGKDGWYHSLYIGISLATFPAPRLYHQGTQLSTDKIAINNERLDAATHEATLASATASTLAQRTQYATDLAARFQAYIDWAMSNWPGNTVLDPAAFSASRHELTTLLATLGTDAQNSTDPATPGAAQFVPVDPMPWP